MARDRLVAALVERARQREAEVQLVLASLHLVYGVLGLIAIVHHLRRFWRAVKGAPFTPGV